MGTNHGCCTCDSQYTCDKCKQEAQEHLETYIKKGCHCRSCNEFNDYAEPDAVIDDGKFTCWHCGNHPDRKKRGLPSDKVKYIDKIYSKASNKKI